LVVAALAAISVALLVRAERAVERLALKSVGDQIGAYLDAGQAQALADLARVLAEQPDGILRPGQGWDLPRDVPIDRGRVVWVIEDLQGRFNLGWLADEQEWGDTARAAFRRLALEEGVPEALIARLIRAAGPDALARAGALGAASPPDLPLILPQQLSAAARAADGGAAVLAPFWPLLAALPLDAGWNVATAPLAVMQALVPGLEAADWEEFTLARMAGIIVDGDSLMSYAAQNWPPEVAAPLQGLPFVAGTEWLELRVHARLDSQARGRSAVVRLEPPNGGGLAEPRILLTLPIEP
jgi:general secretion pathway protein K